MKWSYYNHSCLRLGENTILARIFIRILIVCKTIHYICCLRWRCFCIDVKSATIEMWKENYEHWAYVFFFSSSLGHIHLSAVPYYIMRASPTTISHIILERDLVGHKHIQSGADKILSFSGKSCKRFFWKLVVSGWLTGLTVCPDVS